MAQAAPLVSESINVANSTVRSTAQRVTIAMTQTGEYARVATQPGKLVFERSFKPSMGLGFVTKTERCVFTLAESQGRVTVAVAGRCLDDRLIAVRAAVRGQSMATEALNEEYGAVDVMPEVGSVVNEPPPPIVDPAGRSQQASRPQWAPPPSAPPPKPVPPPQPSLEPASPPMTDGPIQPMPGGMPGGAVDASSTRSLVLDLGEGSAPVSLDRRLVIGREPRLGAVAPHGINPSIVARAVPVDDFTLSRTHCWIEPSREGALICDLHSTNGTYVVDNQGRVVTLKPGDPTYVEPGTEVRFGDFVAKLRFERQG